MLLLEIRNVHAEKALASTLASACCKVAVSRATAMQRKNLPRRMFLRLGPMFPLRVLSEKYSFSLMRYAESRPCFKRTRTFRHRNPCLSPCQRLTAWRGSGRARETPAATAGQPLFSNGIRRSPRDAGVSRDMQPHGIRDPCGFHHLRRKSNGWRQQRKTPHAPVGRKLMRPAGHNALCRKKLPKHRQPQAQFVGRNGLFYWLKAAALPWETTAGDEHNRGCQDAHGRWTLTS